MEEKQNKRKKKGKSKNDEYSRPKPFPPHLFHVPPPKGDRLGQEQQELQGEQQQGQENETQGEAVKWSLIKPFHEMKLVTFFRPGQ